MSKQNLKEAQYDLIQVAQAFKHEAIDVQYIVCFMFLQKHGLTVLQSLNDQLEPWHPIEEFKQIGTFLTKGIDTVTGNEAYGLTEISGGNITDLCNTAVFESVYVPINVAKLEL